MMMDPSKHWIIIIVFKKGHFDGNLGRRILICSND